VKLALLVGFITKKITNYVFPMYLLLSAVMSESFKARDIGLRAQKKILSRMANKNIAKVFIDDTTASLLDNVYKLAKAYVSCHIYST
jgi:hypothetical protein